MVNTILINNLNTDAGYRQQIDGTMLLNVFNILYLL